MKRIILAVGAASRLYPLTAVINKHLLPVYDKPMIYYPLSVLMSAGIHDILLISTPESLLRMQSLLKDGSKYGIHLCYVAQDQLRSLADVFNVGRNFINNDRICFILGDNILYMSQLLSNLRDITKQRQGETVFVYYVQNLSDYEVVEFNKEGQAISIEKTSQSKIELCCNRVIFL